MALLHMTGAGMDIWESVRMAGTTLVSHKLRSILTMLGIIIGNASVVATIGIGQGAQQLAESEFDSLGPNILFIRAGSSKARRTTFDLPKTLVFQDAQAIATQVPSITSVAPQIDSRLLITHRNANVNTQVIGTTPEYLSVRKFELEQGRFLNQSDIKRNDRVAVLGAEITQRFFPNQTALGQRIRIKNVSFEIIGILAEKGSFLGTNQDETVLIPISTMATQLSGRTSPYGIQLSLISVSANDANDIDAARFQMENLLRLRHKITDEDDFTVRPAKELVAIIDKVTSGLTAMLAAIASISLLVGGIGVMNIMLVSVTERTQEIGLRKAVGAQNRDILLQFLIEALILSATGGFIGITLGVGGLILISLLSPLSAPLSPFAMVLALGVSGTIGLSFGVLPARRAAQLDPIVALRGI